MVREQSSVTEQNLPPFTLSHSEWVIVNVNKSCKDKCFLGDVTFLWVNNLMLHGKHDISHYLNTTELNIIILLKCCTGIAYRSKTLLLIVFRIVKVIVLNFVGEKCIPLWIYIFMYLVVEADTNQSHGCLTRDTRGRHIAFQHVWCLSCLKR